jgi:hypothetical protein
MVNDPVRAKGGVLKKYISWLLTAPLARYLHFSFLIFMLFILPDWQHENNLYENIGRSVVRHAVIKNDTAIVASAMKIIQSNMAMRSRIFEGQERISWKQSLFRSADVELMYGSGACGGYSMVLARTLDLLGYKVRIAQLKTVKSGYGGHIIIEYYSDMYNKWVLIDPLFNWMPRDPSGTPADIRSVIEHWSDYEDQMPLEIKNRFYFEGVRYTNWDKFGLLSRTAYKVLSFTFGKETTDHLSLRMYVISIYPSLFFSALSIYAILLLFTFGFFKRKWKAECISDVANTAGTQPV